MRRLFERDDSRGSAPAPRAPRKARAMSRRQWRPPLSRIGLAVALAIPVALAALAIGQMGVHLVFFLHITTGPDNTNNVLALAFGALIVGLVIAGSIWIIWSLNARMMLPGDMTPMPR